MIFIIAGDSVILRNKVTKNLLNGLSETANPYGKAHFVGFGVYDEPKKTGRRGRRTLYTFLAYYFKP